MDHSGVKHPPLACACFVVKSVEAWNADSLGRRCRTGDISSRTYSIFRYPGEFSWPKPKRGGLNSINICRRLTLTLFNAWMIILIFLTKALCQVSVGGCWAYRPALVREKSEHVDLIAGPIERLMLIESRPGSVGKLSLSPRQSADLRNSGTSSRRAYLLYRQRTFPLSLMATSERQSTLL